MAYHVKTNECPASECPPSTDVEPILFRSRSLSTAEKNYWPIEPETAGLVWVLKKIRMHVGLSRVPPTIVYTDHSSDQLYHNFSYREVESSPRLSAESISRFALDIGHKPGKDNIVPNALSRLEVESTSDDTLPSREGELDTLLGAWSGEVNIAPTDELQIILTVDIHRQLYRDRLYVTRYSANI